MTYVPFRIPSGLQMFFQRLARTAGTVLTRRSLHSAPAKTRTSSRFLWGAAAVLSTSLVCAQTIHLDALPRDEPETISPLYPSCSQHKE